MEALKDEKQPTGCASCWCRSMGCYEGLENSPSEYLFPRYCSEQGCKADYASNSLNKWLRKHVPNGCVVHSFRHSMRDQLRAVECPAEIIDQIGGWKTAGVGEGYGVGFKPKTLLAWLRQI